MRNRRLKCIQVFWEGESDLVRLFLTQRRHRFKTIGLLVDETLLTTLATKKRNVARQLTSFKVDKNAYL